jgi:hypothetical protein
MKQSQTQQYNDDVILVCIAIIYTLLTLLFLFISELWHSFKSNTKSPKSLATNLSPKKKVQNNTQPILTSSTHQVEPCLAQETSSAISKESSVATGSQPVVTTRRKTKTNSRAGTTSQRSKTSKSGPLTQSASLPVTTK